ncbi:hypothetical protein M2145_002557 [Lachnospiraceae bacterium PF1-21]
MKNNTLKRLTSMALIGTMVITMTGCSKNADAKEEKEVAKKIEMVMAAEQVTVVANEKTSATKFVKELDAKDATLNFQIANKGKEESVDKNAVMLTIDLPATVKYSKKNIPLVDVSFDKVGKTTVEVVAKAADYKDAKSDINVIVVDEIAKYAKGITDNVNVLEGTTGLDLLKGIELDKTKIKSLTVDDSKVDYKKSGTYDIVYMITTINDKKIEVPVHVIVVDKNTAKDMANNGETVLDGSEKEVEKSEDKKEDSKKEDDKKSDGSKDTSKDTAKDTPKKDDDKTSSTGNSSSNTGGNSGSSNPSTPSTPSDPNAGKTKVWVVDVPAQTEQGHTEDHGRYESQFSHNVIQCYCGAEFTSSGDWVNHDTATDCGGYSIVPKYNEVWIPNPVWVVDVPAQAEQGHWEWR